jgi:hypothetical protein
MTPRERQRKDESSGSFAPEISGEREQATSLKEASTPPNRTYDDAKLNDVINLLDSSNDPRHAIPLALASQVMEPILKIEDSVPIDNPVTAPMPLTLSAVRSAEASATVAGPNQPQVLPETPTEPLPEAPAVRRAGAQWTSEQEDAANRSLSFRYMTDLMTVMSGRRPLLGALETVDKLADPKLKPYHAESLKLVDRPNESTLEYVNNAMHSIQLDLDSGSNNFIPKMSAAKRERVKAIVKEWQELRLTAAAPLRLSEGNVFELKAVLENSKLGRQPVRPTKGNG